MSDGRSVLGFASADCRVVCKHEAGGCCQVVHRQQVHCCAKIIIPHILYVTDSMLNFFVYFRPGRSWPNDEVGSAAHQGRVRSRAVARSH